MELRSERRKLHSGGFTQASGSSLTGRQTRCVHPRLEPVGAGRRNRPRNAAHEGRGEELRVCDRQRWMGSQRPRHSPLVARFKKDRHAAAGRARCRRHVPSRHSCRASAPDDVERSAARRQCGCDDSSRDNRSRRRQDRPPPDSARLSPRNAWRRSEHG